MIANIRILPSGREFCAGPHETILDAALRAGIPLTYSCNNGSCGECRARLVNGSIGETRYHDYRFSEAEQAAGYFLTCRSSAADDLEIEAGEAGGVEDIPIQRITAQVYKLEHPHPDVMVVHLRTPRSKTLRFLAGQHVMLEIEGLPPRNKSIASCPCMAMNLQFHIRRAPGDPFSEYCFSALKVGQQVTVTGPTGAFTFDDEANRPVIFLAYDTGFAPIKSLIEHAISLDFSLPMHLYWVAPNAANHYLDNYCRSWLDAFSNFSFTPLVGDEAGDDSLPVVDHNLLLGARRIIADYPDLAPFEVYVNGPESAMSQTRSLLLEHGLPESRLHIDSYLRF